MMIVPMIPEHMEFCKFDPVFADIASRQDAEALANSREAWAVLDHRSTVLGVFGVTEVNPGVLYLWGFFSPGACRHVRPLMRHVKRWLASLDAVRVEATVVKNFRFGHRSLQWLRFRRETTRPMKKWDGVLDFHLYSQVRA